MRFTNIISAAAFAVALGVSGAASAATIVGGVTVIDIDLPRVQAMCDQMVGDTAKAEGQVIDSNEEMKSQMPDGLDDISIEDCITAGLLPADTEIQADTITK